LEYKHLLPPTADVITVDLAEAEALIIGSDGLWDVMPPQHVASLILPPLWGWPPAPPPPIASPIASGSAAQREGERESEEVISNVPEMGWSHWSVPQMGARVVDEAYDAGKCSKVRK